MLPIIGFATLYLRYTHLPRPIAPKALITLILWIVSSITLVLMGYSVLRRLGLGLNTDARPQSRRPLLTPPRKH